MNICKEIALKYLDISEKLLKLIKVGDEELDHESVEVIKQVIQKVNNNPGKLQKEEYELIEAIHDQLSLFLGSMLKEPAPELSMIVDPKNFVDVEIDDEIVMDEIDPYEEIKRINKVKGIEQTLQTATTKVLMKEAHKEKPNLEIIKDINAGEVGLCLGNGSTEHPLVFVTLPEFWDKETQLSFIKSMKQVESLVGNECHIIIIGSEFNGIKIELATESLLSQLGLKRIGKKRRNRYN